MSRMIDRNRLKEAIDNLNSLGKSERAKNFTWNGLADSSVDIEAVYIQGVGPVAVPLRSSDVDKLIEKFPWTAKAARLEKYQIACCQIDASQLTIIPKIEGMSQQKMLQELAYNTLQSMLDINFENLSFNIEAKLDKLVICKGSGLYTGVLSSSNEPGNFGTLLLKIPVGIDKPSGRVDFFPNGILQSQVRLGSNSCYSIAAIAGECSSERKARFTINTSHDEVTAVAILSLKWDDRVMFNLKDLIPAQFFPQFFVLTNDIKKALMPWHLTEPVASTSRESGHNIEKAQFLCLPGSAYIGNGKDLTPSGLIVAWCLDSVTFLDVHYANIAPVRTRGPDSEVILSSSLFQFVEKTRSSFHSIADELFIRAIEVRKHFVCDVSEYGQFSVSEEDSSSSTAPAVVIRPRILHRLMVSESAAKRKAELFVGSLLSVSNSYSENMMLDNVFVLKSYRRELEQIVESLKDLRYARDTASVVVCQRCFFSHLFVVCCRLKAEDVALRILKDVLAGLTTKHLLVGSCRDSQDCNADFEVAFSQFICFAKGWELCPDIMKQLTNEMMTTDSCLGIISEITLNYLAMNNVEAAQESFKLILNTVKNLKPEGIRQKFHVGIVTVAIHLQTEECQDHALDVLLSQVKHLEPFQLAELTEHLGELSQDERLDCKFFMKELAKFIVETRFNDFSPCEFLDTVEAYRTAGERQLVRGFWKTLCLQCTEIFDSGETDDSCLFCAILGEEKSEDAQFQMATDLAEVDEFEEAAKCSLQKLKYHLQPFSVNKWLEYVCSLRLMEDVAQIPGVEIVDHFSAFFAQLDSKTLYLLIDSLNTFRSSLIFQKASTVRRLFKSLLRRIGSLDPNDIADLDVDYVIDIVFFAATLDKLVIVRPIMRKLDAAVANNTMNHATKVSIILHVLRTASEDSGAIELSRDVFYLLLHECLKSLRRVTDRHPCCVEVFQMSAAAERYFEEPPPVFVRESWTALIERLTFWQTVAVVKTILESDVHQSEESSIKRLPSSCETFMELFASVSEKCTQAADEGTQETDRTLRDESYLVSFTRWSFWEGDVDYVKLGGTIDCFRRSDPELADVHGAIVRDPLIVELATRSTRAALAFNDLVDKRIQILNERLANSVKDAISCVKAFVMQSNRRKTNRVPSDFTLGKSSSHEMESARKYLRLDSLDELTDDQTKWQEEIVELQELRKEILRKSLLNSSDDESSSNSEAFSDDEPSSD